ncbi:PAS domain S-box protein [Roseococcus sp. YIM B11640]|uniref:PAS domain S-box protein n=1 Tax=Roseococcus sp. YIM B11640 TaxID=3133973 RepID=UPI003C7BC3EA
MFSSIARAIASDLELSGLMNMVTDAATQWSGAKIGAFFYNASDASSGEAFSLYSLSGAAQGTFETFPIPGETKGFAPTFSTDIVRSGDIRNDPRFLRDAQHLVMPQMQLPVVSYLAVPVISRTGAVLGGLLLMHDEPEVFGEEEEEVVSAIAVHAGIAIDNARLLEALRHGAETRNAMHDVNARLAAIVENSDDAILSKSLDGIIQSWNPGARRLFGLTAEEAIGRHITILIPSERLAEEDLIIGKIRAGEPVSHYETQRRRKDGSLIDISLSVSPVRDPHGRVIGASKIARDISELKRARERQMLLLREMNHRVKNLFAVASGLIGLSAATASDVTELATLLRERLNALSRAHELTLPDLSPGGSMESQATKLFSLLRVILAPHDSTAAPRISISGADVPIRSGPLTSFALLLHEFATNAAKYGALSAPAGRVDITSRAEDGVLLLDWVETGGPRLQQDHREEGFGTMLERAAVEGTLGGSIHREWKEGGVSIRLRLPLSELSG